MLFKKTLVLSSTCGGNEKAVINFEKDNGNTIGEIKLYNLKEEPNGILSLGLKENSEVHKAGLTRIGSFKYTFCFTCPLALEKFSVAVININHGEVKALVHGSTENTKISDEILAGVALEMDSANSMKECEQILNDNHIELEDMDEVEKEIDTLVKSEESCEKCSGCKYRYAFYTNEENNEQQEETFYDSISEDLNKLFSENSEEEFLSEIIPFSKWVKIENEENDEYYVLGLIYENDKVKYICYGVPSMNSDNPPKDLAGYADWLPIDSTDENGFGYWITYQDAENGDNVKATFTVV